METPTNDRSTPRLSSSLKKNRKSLGLDNSASKLVKTLIQKEKLRKINHYKHFKTKRAEILVKNRHINDEEVGEEEQEQKIDIDYPEKENVSQMTDVSMLENEIFPIKNEPLIETKQPVVQNITGGISSKLSSSIIRRINSFKSSLKSMVSSKHLIPKDETKCVKNEINENVPNHVNKVRRSISVGSFQNPCFKTKPSVLASKFLKKQESTSSVQFNPPSTLLSSKNSAFSSTSSLRSTHHNSSSSLNKPVFKISTKIQYNDSHLYRSDVPETDKNKNQKIILTRKIARTSATSLDKMKI